MQLVILPLLIVASFGCGLRFRRWRRRLLALTAVLLDAWLWLVVLATPLGPHPRAALWLVLVNLPLAFAVVSNVTGFEVPGRFGRLRGYDPDGRDR